MASQRHLDQAIKLPVLYKLIKDNQRTLKCSYDTPKGAKPCLTRFRVKIIEPDVYERKCPKCNQVSYFQLIETGTVVDGLRLLRFKWITKKTADKMSAAFLKDCVDLSYLIKVTTVDQDAS